MTDLTGRLISNTYKQLILVSSAVSNEGVDTSLKPIQTGDGTNTALKVATNAVQVSGALGVTGSVSLDSNLHVDDRVCASAFYGDGSNITGVTAVIAGNISVSNAVVGGTLQVSSTATIVGATHLKSTVTVGGAANFGSTVTVEGKAVFKDDVSVSGAANFGSTVTVEGEAIFNNNVSVSGTFNVEGASTFTSKATFNNDVSISGRLDVATSACIGGLAKFKDDVSVSGGLNVGGSVTIAGTNIQATNARVCASAFHGDGSNLTNIQAELGVTTNISVSGFINAGGAVSVSGTFNAVGSSTFKNDVSVSGNLRIGGTTTIAGAVSLASTLSVAGASNFASTVTIAGAVSLASTLSVAGASNFASTVTIAGATSLGSTLDVTGNTSIGGTFLATGKAEFEDDVSVSGNVNIGGTTTIAGAVSLASTLSVGGAANFLSTVTIAGNNVQAANARVCASAYYGDGSNLSGITTSIEGDISVSALTVGGEISVSGGRITIKTSASDPANIRFYCESANAHYAELRSPPHASYAGNITITLPNTTVTLVGTSTTNTLVNKTFGDKVEFDSDISVSGNSNLVGNVSIGGTLINTGKAEFEDDVSVSGALIVGGASQLNGTVTVAGAVSLASTLSVGGATNFGSTVTVAGAVSLASTLSVGGATHLASTVTVAGAATFEDAVSVSGAVNIAGNTSVGGTFLATGKAEFEGDVSVSGKIQINATDGTESLNVNGAIGSKGASSDFSAGPSRTLIDNTGSLGRVGTVNGTGSATPLGLLTGNTERMRIDTSGRVNMGSSLDSSVAGYQLKLQSTGNAQQLIKAATNYNSTIAFGDPDSDTVGEIVYAHNGDSMRFNVNGGEKARFLSGGGITFNGDTSTNNALDDYEQGSWTATLDGSTSGPSTSVTQTGAYTKIGNVVFCHALFTNVNTTGAAGHVQITGMPFDPNLTIPTGNVMSQLTFNVNSTTANITPFIASATLLRFYGTLEGANVWVAMQHSAGTGRYLYFSIMYHTNE
jgi:UDP-3-O-[3-hydroxymyristoyl] glucosamine N-acyltransferase